MDWSLGLTVKVVLLKNVSLLQFDRQREKKLRGGLINKL